MDALEISTERVDDIPLLLGVMERIGLKVEGLLEVDYEKQVERQTRYKGRGRGAKHRPKQVPETIRYQITEVNRLEDLIQQTKESVCNRCDARTAQFGASGEVLPQGISSGTDLSAIEKSLEYRATVCPTR